VLALLLLLTLISASSAQETATAIPVGQLVEKIICTRDPNQSYALYLPRNYDQRRENARELKEVLQMVLAPFITPAAASKLDGGGCSLNNTKSAVSTLRKPRHTGCD